MQHTKPRYPLAEAFKLLGLSRSKGYLRIKSDNLRTVTDGDRQYVTAAEIDRYCCQSHPPIAYPPPRQQLAK